VTLCLIDCKAEDFGDELWKKMGAPTVMISVSYDVLLCKELPFEVMMIAPLKFLVALVFNCN